MIYELFYFNIFPKRDLSSQDLEFLRLSESLTEDVFSVDSTVQSLLKYCPDSFRHLLDLCLVKPVDCQVQGDVFLDFFLFKNNKKGGKSLFSCESNSRNSRLWSLHHFDVISA